ncbi:MAG: exosortase K [Microscillaceae bacterium]|nr:exosortase K [Microscillaceae bacterium]
MNLADKKNIFLYFILLAGLILAKLYHREASNLDLGWILYPTVWLVTFFSGVVFELSAEGGFVDTSQMLIIDKSCSGMNFMLICICVLSFTYLPRLPWKPAYFCIFLGLSYGFTVLVNACRIIQAIWLREKFENQLPFKPEVIHEMQGILVYVFFLILFFLISRYIFNHSILRSHEKIV